MMFVTAVFEGIRSGVCECGDRNWGLTPLIIPQKKCPKEKQHGKTGI